jgi:GDSL-like Lipase/Acylhydrolase family
VRGVRLAAAVVVVWAWAVGTAGADGPGVGTPAIVALGDSAISGEAGRWAGNTNNASWRVDALGPTAYHDVAGGEAIAGCHRSQAAEVHIGGGVLSANLACSGARTATRLSGSTFKPGIDFYEDSAGRVGQALALQRYAAARNVKAVVVLIGANDYGFADIVERCVTNWLTSPSWWPNYCHDDSSISSRFSAANVAAITDRVRGALLNVRTAMTRAGYADGQYRILAQTYSSPVPRGAGFRYPQSGWTRQTIGGCGVWNRDADWANDTVVRVFNDTIRNAVAQSGLTNVSLLDMRDALVGHRLCESSVGLLEERGLSSWRDPGAVDRTEWVSQIRTVTTIVGPYQLQEGGHPSYWGQLALRNCLRQAYNAGAPRGGTCVNGTGLTAVGEPVMTLR